MTIPSVLDDSLAPPGHHVCLFFTQYTPYGLRGGRNWDAEAKEEYANVVFDTVERYAPGKEEEDMGSYGAELHENWALSGAVGL